MRSKINQTFSLLFSFLWLMSLSVGFLFINNFQLIEKQDLVYCPLQKTWVKRNEESKPLRQNPLDQICMSDSKKLEIAMQISLKNAFAVNEKGIFETLKSGVKALDHYRETPNLPNQTLAQSQRFVSILNSANELKQTFVIKAEAFSFSLNSRPPTIEKVRVFDFQTAQTLDQISRNINPRSPPFFI